MIRQVAVLVALLANGGGCAIHRQPAGDVTAGIMRQIHGALLEVRTIDGKLPDSLELVCRRNARFCQLMPVDKWRRDEWGRPILYIPYDGEFALRSMGIDGTANNADDLVLSSSAEHQRVVGFAGCYRMRIPQWKDFPGDLVVLRPVPNGSAYHLSPNVGDYLGAWVPLGADSVELFWINVDRSVSLILGQRGDSLIGRADGKSRDVAAVRVICP